MITKGYFLVSSYRIDAPIKDQIISSDTLEKAALLQKEDPSKKAIVFGDSVALLDNETVSALMGKYGNAIHNEKGVAVAKKEAAAFLEGWYKFVNEDYNFANADKNKDGMLTVAESLDARNVVTPFGDSVVLKTSRETLSDKEIKSLEKNNALFAKIDDVFAYHINLDKNFDGKISFSETGQDPTLKKLLALKEYQSQQSGGASAETTLKKLYEQKEKLEKKIKELEQKIKNTQDPAAIEMLQRQLETLKALLISVVTAILKALEESRKH